MAIDWSDNNKRKAFRLALQRAYPREADLRLFVDEELNENLAAIAANNNLQSTAHDLVSWAQAKSRLDEVFEAFCRENPNDPVIAELQQRPLIKRSSNLGEEDWEALFAQFSPYDFADIQRAFLQGFQRVLNAAFQQVRPDHPPLTEQAQVQELLATYDKPELAVRFVEFVIVEFQRSSAESRRDLTGLEQWRDRISQKYKIFPLTPEPEQKTVRQGYLLVACEESGSDVVLYPELRVTGEEKPIKFSASPVKCAFEELPAYLSDWIYQAEKALDGKQNSEEILLELFLPCAMLEADLAMWDVRDKRGRPISLGMHRMFIVRSFDRIRDKDLQPVLARKWELLQKSVRDGTACDQFHLQDKYPEKKGALSVLLKRVPGLKLVAELPLEPEKRKDLLYEIIDAAVPITLWTPNANEAILAELKTQMYNLSRESQLTNFADLAYKWREKLAQPETESIKHIRLLCDCPDRLPKLPDPEQEDDLLVAF